jgi:hypothetical protein
MVTYTAIETTFNSDENITNQHALLISTHPAADKHTSSADAGIFHVHSQIPLEDVAFYLKFPCRPGRESLTCIVYLFGRNCEENLHNVNVREASTIWMTTKGILRIVKEDQKMLIRMRGYIGYMQSTSTVVLERHNTSCHADTYICRWRI